MESAEDDELPEVWVPELGAEGPEEDPPLRPRTRADCIGGFRPCPWVGCRYHLLLELAPRLYPTAKTWTTIPDRALVDMLLTLEQTCSLDLVVDGGLVLEEVGSIYRVTRERIRQIQHKAIEHMTKRIGAQGRERELLDLMYDLAEQRARSTVVRMRHNPKSW